MLSVIEELTGKLPDADAALREWVTAWIPTEANQLLAMAQRQSAELFDLHTRLFAAREGRLPYTTMKTPAIRQRMNAPPDPDRCDRRSAPTGRPP